MASLNSIPSSINVFGAALFTALQHESRSSTSSGAAMVISPFSIAHALAMLLQGAAPGSTTQAQVLRLVFGSAGVGDADSLVTLNAQLKQLAAALEQAGSGSDSDSGPTVADANSVWVRAGMALQPDFKNTLSDVFDAEAATITTAAAVNQWVSDATRGKINEIVDDEMLKMMELVLINAIYFRGFWELQFDRSLTRPAPFHLLSGGPPTDVAMMYRQFTGRELMNVSLAQLLVQVAPSDSGDGGGDGGGEVATAIPCSLLRLPYRCGDYAAVAAMPMGDLSTTAGGLTVAPVGADGMAVPYTSALAACRSAVLGGLAGTAAAAASSPGAAPAAASTADIDWQPARTTLKLWLPRFELTYSAQLNDTLCTLGLAAPFVPGDLTRIAAQPGGAPVTDLAVGSVLHKAYIKVDEQGTEAAAVTAVMLTRAALPVPQQELEVRFDRPFMFAVIHVPTSTALFVSEVYEPKECKG